jgi:hypothetical protein
MDEMERIPEADNQRCTACEEWGNIRSRGEFLDDSPYRLCAGCSDLYRALPREIAAQFRRRLWEKAALEHFPPAGSA